ncbi:MAG: pirin family protein [Bacteroidia bacterium]|nr:pirin family protein [Bacteroidia bacterium]
MYKTVERNIQLTFKQAFPGLKGIDIFAHQLPVEPFLVITEYYMSQPVFGPHPHAGISVMTYMLPDSPIGFINRDSNGDHSIIEPGGLHITQAGSGIHHDEFPQKPGLDAHGFQIWINHTSENRMVSPKAIHANSDEVVQVVDEDTVVRVLLGSYHGREPVYQIVTPIQLFHVSLKAKKAIEFEAREMAFLYAIKGDGGGHEKYIPEKSISLFSQSGDKVKVDAGEQTFDFLYATATPIKEPIVYGGPFVMTTEEQMQLTKRNYAQGKMGTLKPYHQK